MLLKRINTFVVYSKLSYNKFEISINASRGTISGALKHNRTIGSNVVENILLIYPELRAEWLLRGEGEMLKIPNTENLQTESVRNNRKVEDMISFYERLKESKLEEVMESISKQQFNPSLKNKSLDNLLEQFILSTWDKQYGADLKNIKRQLEIFFRERLDLSKERDLNDDTNGDQFVI